MDEDCLEFFRALADATRQEILELLGEQDCNVNEICKQFDNMTQPTISHHLQILKRCKLVSAERKGKMIYYSINKKIMRNGMEEFIERFDIQIL
ncbi:MAG: metalloregulator ArsR/SmtB family transcription factor [Candidatus Omnitrophota bacterium]